MLVLGSYLGLAICRRLVELMGGQIHVESVPGQGSTFTCTAWFVAGAAVPELVLPDDLNGLKVLVVDDSTAARSVSVELMRELPFSVEAVASGSEALREVANADRDRGYDLVLMDWNMPGMDGLEAARRIKGDAELRRIPAVVLVSALLPEFGDTDMALAADACLAKPVSRSTLVDTLVRLFGHAPHEGRERPATVAGADLSGMRILLAEDIEINQQIAVELLEAAGAQVEVTSDGRLAVQAVLEAVARGEEFDVVLMDIQMPLMDGYQATARLRAQPGLEALPIVAMTAHAMPEERQRCLDAGMNGHITKPIEPDAMLRTLVRWRTPREPATGALPLPDRRLPQDTRGHIPEVAGLDVAGALDRLAGNSRLYLSLLAQFAAQQADADQAIRQALAAGDRGQAQSRAHMVRGVAGNLGAMALGAAAGALETEIAANGSDEVIDAHVAVFTTALAEAVEAVHIALIASGGELASRDADPGQTIALLTELAQMAADDDATLPERFLEVRRDLVAALTAAELVELATGINAYEFVRVRALALQLAGGVAAREDAA